MSQAQLFYPVFAQAALTFALLAAMARARGSFFKTSGVDPNATGLREDVWPTDVKKISNSFHNQLELPILFYAVTAFAILFVKTSAGLVILAWLFVLARLCQAWIHTSSNNVPHRAAAWLLGALILAIMWVWLLVSIVA
jgi:hypothetical protein